MEKKQKDITAREYRTFKTPFPEDAAKVTSFGKDDCQFVQDTCKRFSQSVIFYLAPNITFMGGLLGSLKVEILRCRLYTSSPNIVGIYIRKILILP